MADLKVTVNQDDCTGCGVCEGEAPNSFEMNDDDVAQAKDPVGDDVDTVIAAAESCPVECITVVDASGKTLYPED